MNVTSLLSTVISYSVRIMTGLSLFYPLNSYPYAPTCKSMLYSPLINTSRRRGNDSLGVKGRQRLRTFPRKVDAVLTTLAFKLQFVFLIFLFNAINQLRAIPIRYVNHIYYINRACQESTANKVRLPHQLEYWEILTSSFIISLVKSFSYNVCTPAFGLRRIRESLAGDFNFIGF